MLFFIISGVLFLVAYYLMGMQPRDGKDMRPQERAVVAARAAKIKTAGTARRASTATRTGVRSLTIPTNGIDRHLVLTAFAASVGVAFWIGGVVPAALVLGAVGLCSAPTVLSKVRERSHVRRLLAEAHLLDNQPLYVPEQWQNQKPDR